MTASELTPAALTALLHAEIPMSAYMQVRIEQLDDHGITLLAPFDPNRNIHGTAFAGSLYTLCVLTGWSLLTAYLARRGLHAAVVAHRVEIVYHKPVTGELRAEARLPDAEALAGFERRLTSRGKGRLALAVHIGEQVTVQGDFIALAEG